jgi:radical SAM protein with 4Fe4S-binding SPASM domain
MGAREIQLLRFKPAGRGRLDYLAQRLSEAQVARFPAVLRDLSERLDVGVRIDCALVPFLGDVREEDLVRFGVMGCEAGRSLLAVKADGASSPCSFWEGGGEPAETAWEGDTTLARFRAHRRDPPEPCASCPVVRACRGGCRIVAAHLDGEAFGPDPECPRVRAHRKTRD